MVENFFSYCCSQDYRTRDVPSLFQVKMDLSPTLNVRGITTTTFEEFIDLFYHLGDSIFANGKVWQVSQNATDDVINCCVFPIDVPPTPPGWVNVSGSYLGNATVYNNEVYQWHGKEDGQPYIYSVRASAPTLPFNLNLYPIQWLTPFVEILPSIPDSIFALPPLCSSAPACKMSSKLSALAARSHAIPFLLSLGH